MNKLILCAVLVLGLSACGDTDTEIKTNDNQDTVIVHNNKVSAAYISSVTLNNGTECAVLIGHNGNALDCNWGKKNGN